VRQRVVAVLPERQGVRVRYPECGRRRHPESPEGRKPKSAQVRGARGARYPRCDAVRKFRCGEIGGEVCRANVASLYSGSASQQRWCVETRYMLRTKQNERVGAL